MPIKPIHCERHTIGMTSITHPHTNRFFILPLQQVFSREKRRFILAPTLLLLVDRKHIAYKFYWMQNRLQIVLLNEHWILTAVHTRLIRSLTICVK